MSGIPILDLVVGMIFIYFLLSIICSSAVELCFSVFKTRAKVLADWLRRIFDQPALDSSGSKIILVDNNGKEILDSKGQPQFVTLGQAIMDHCITNALSNKGESTSYIDAENFVSALLDKISIAPATGTQIQLPPADLAGYTAAISNSPVISGELKRTFLAFANEAKQASDLIKTIPAAATVAANVKSELDEFRDRLETWYNKNSDRLSGTLKRKKALPLTIVIGAILTVSLNMDSISMSRYLYDHKEIAKSFADKATSSIESYKERIDQIKDSAGAKVAQDLDNNLKQVKNDIAVMKASVPTGFPIGWNKTVTANTGNNESENFLSMFFGWIATILAICLGAPFWFDILNKIANLRSTGPKPPVTTDNSATS
jgi:hypothetical protein